MRFERPGLEAEFIQIHANVRVMAKRFDEFCVKSGYGESVPTSIQRVPGFYDANKLEKPGFSWHFVDCAIDFKNKHLTAEAKLQCKLWLVTATRDGRWELITDPHGTGPHFHLAFRDYSRRLDWEKNRRIKNV